MLYMLSFALPASLFSFHQLSIVTSYIATCFRITLHASQFSQVEHVPENNIVTLFYIKKNNSIFIHF